MNASVSIRATLAAAVVVLSFAVPSARADDNDSPLEALRAYAETHDETPNSEAASSEAATPSTKAEAASGAPVAQSPVNAARERLMPLIEKAARDHSIPPALLDAVVRIESRYNPHVKNAGAIGLMQIKLATARGIGFTGDAAALSKPETNLQWGAKYLARAYQMSKGDTCLTLARYQGGHRVEKMGPAGKAYCAKVRTVLAQLN